MLEPLYGLTLAPTIVHSNSEAVNVYPTEVVITVDCRTPVGHDKREVEAEVGAALAGLDADWELEWVKVIVGTASGYPTPLSDAVRTVLERHVPHAELGHEHCVGFTDAHWFRVASPETVAYNVTPYVYERREDVYQRAHNVDERIHVRDLAFQALFAEDVALEVLQ